MKNFIIKTFNIGLFGADDVIHGTTAYVNANTPASSVDYTSSQGLSAEMKTYYSDYLIDNAEPKLVHAQFGQKTAIPKNGGKTIEFRKYDSLPKATTPLTEGVTPTGGKMNVTTITDTVKQYGYYIALTDMFMTTAIDNNLVQATKLLASQAGRTLDTVVREILNAGTNVQYGDGSVTARNLLVGGADTGNNYMTVDCIRKAVTTLKRQNTEKIGDSYVGIIHPDVSHDLMSDPNWKYPHQYVDTDNIYSGEIGKLYGVRFVETTEAKIFAGAGKDKRDVYSTLILGENAFGVTELSGMGLRHITKQLGTAGTADPLDQRATAGWKAVLSAVILSQQYMVRIETASTSASGAN